MTRLRILLVALAVVAASVVRADAPPALTELQRLQVQTLTQAIEIAQLKALAAKRDFDEAKQSLQALVQQLQRPGYTLDLQTMTYLPDPSAETPPAKP